jgi:hypothetical protein
VLLAAAIGRAVPPDRAADRSVRLSLPSVSTFTAAAMAFVVAATLLPQPGKAALGVALLAAAALLAGVFDRNGGESHVAVDGAGSMPRASYRPASCCALR